MEDINYKPEGTVYIGATVTLPNGTTGEVKDLWIKKGILMAEVNGSFYPAAELQNEHQDRVQGE